MCGGDGCGLVGDGQLDPFFLFSKLETNFCLDETKAA